MKKKVCYVDLDGVVADFNKMFAALAPDLDMGCGEGYEERSKKVDQICADNLNLFEDLEPINGAIDAVHKLAEVYDIYFLSTPVWAVPESFTGKRRWIEKHFPEVGKKRLILTHRKDLNRGDYLIDDRLKHGVEEFQGEHIHFATEKFPDWEAVLDYLLVTKDESKWIAPNAKKKIAVFTGAGIDAESGINTFRDTDDGLWYNYEIEEVATVDAIRKNPTKVNEFHNMLRAKLKDVQPNQAHTLLAKLEKQFDVTVVTQNVSDLHERGGSSNVLHLHGELYKSRSSLNPKLIYECYGDINIGDKCEKGSQLRPHTVLFGEYPYNVDEAYAAIRRCDYLIIIGTSFQISYTLDLVKEVSPYTEVFYIDVEPKPYLESYGIPVSYIKKPATEGVAEVFSKLFIQDIRESTFGMSDAEAIPVIDSYLKKFPELLNTNDKEWYYKNC